MRIIFMGTPEFAVASLDILHKNNYNIVAVITSVDSYGGRGGKQLIESAVKKYAIAHDLPVLQPKNLKNPAFVAHLKELNADIQIVVAFRMLPEIVWNMPPLGTFNLHGSLLPKYRGAAPIHHAVIRGEKVTGVTSFKLKHEIDTGDVLIRRSLDIGPDDNTGMVHDKMMALGAEVILDTVKMIENGEYTFLPQNDDDATNAPKIFHETCKINFDQDIETVYDFIRGLSPFPGAWFTVDGKEMKVLQATKETNFGSENIGDILTDDKKYIKVKCQNGYIRLEQIKPEGKRLMPVSEYLNGHKMTAGKVD